MNTSASAWSSFPLRRSMRRNKTLSSTTCCQEEANVYLLRIFTVLLGAEDLMVEREMIGIMQTAYKSSDPMHVIAEIRSWPRGLRQVVAFL